VVSALGCDSASSTEDCVTNSADPVPGTAGRCPPSKFAVETGPARGALGRVVTGTQFAAGALVRIDPTPGFLNARHVPPQTTFTDDGGIYRFPTAALRYDVTARVDRDVTFYSSVGARYLEPAFEHEATTQAWTAVIRPVIRGGHGGHKLAFFVSGPLAVGIAGDEPESGITVSFREFGSTIRVHAVEYPPAQGIGAAVAYGARDLTLRSNEQQFPEIFLSPVTEVVDFVVDPIAPAGFVRRPIEVLLDFGLRTNEQVIARVKPGGTAKVPMFPFPSRYFVRAAATLDGAISDTGRRPVDPRLGRFDYVLPDPPTDVAPAEGTTITADSVLRAKATGVTEHLLVPVSGDGATLRIVTTDRETRIPDVQTMGLPRLFGRYVWTVRSFPDLPFVEDHGGVEASVANARGSAKPHEIVF
jgi:hypothetical protein